MYTLVSAIGKLLGGGNRWKNVDIGAMPVSQIFSTYAGVIATLSNPFLPAQVALNLLDIRAQYGTRSETFNQLLAAIGNEALPTSTTLPVLKTRYAKYADAFHARYKVQPIHPLWAADNEMPPAERTWLQLTRPETDYALFKRSCMISVNGLYHFVDGDANGIYVHEGDRTRQISGHNNIGIFSFRELGALKYIAITPEMVYKQRPEQKLRHHAYIDIGEDISNKTVLLVIGGYLHVLDTKTVFRTGDQSVGIDMQALPLFERYHESRELLDYAPLQLETTVVNPTQVGVDDFLSDEVLTRYLTLSQSFIVLLDNPDVFVDHVQLRTTRIPGTFIGYTKPQFPLVAGFGMHPNYWYTYEDRQWSIAVTSKAGVIDNPLYHTVDLAKQRSIADSRDPELRHRFSGAQFLQIGRDL